MLPRHESYLQAPRGSGLGLHQCHVLTLPPSPAGGTAGASSDPKVGCDRSRALLHADERPESTVPGKVRTAVPTPSPCCAPSHAAHVPLKSKKSVTVAETPSAVSRQPESDAAETVASTKTDAILRAAKKDLLSLMKLDVSAQPAGPAVADGAAAPSQAAGIQLPRTGLSTELPDARPLHGPSPHLRRDCFGLRMVCSRCMGLRVAGEGWCLARILWAGPPPRTPMGVRVMVP